ncbi:MAG: hypothetical protein K9N49_07445 [Candidatus Marinimicrobia bacterium]|nr:hypothetical protein [Candidatus Neomarinimicrobiota bacterium]
MKKNGWVWFLALGLGLALWAGCDDKPSTSNLDDAFLDGPGTEADPRTNNITALLSVAPASVQAAQVGQKFAFKAMGGKGPYRWEVSDRRAGRVRVEGWSAAVYEVLRLAPNSVIVYDSQGHAGVAQVTVGEDPDPPDPPDPAAPLALAADPGTLSGNGDLSLLTASGGSPPYRWTVRDITLGTLDRSTGTQVTYQRGFRGDNSVTVTDNAGATASVVIRQP